jgi:uncharacterized protein YndB with AHSA1/START domain
MRSRALLLPALAACSAPVFAEVKSAAADGFVSENKAVVAAPPAQAYAALGRVGSWWNSGHTYSGKAANLRLGLKAGDCFCEAWDGGSIEHGRVIYARPGEQLRLSGALGPLQAQAVTGTLTWTLKAVPGGTEITQTYVVGGYIPGGADKFSKPVDQVMAQQLAGLTKSLAK